MHRNHSFDVLIIGSGAAGLTLALRLPDSLSVAVISKGPLTEGSTYYAQGGISAVLDAADSVDAHVADTLDAGAGLCDPDMVRGIVAQGPEAIRWLIGQGVEFTRSDDDPEQYHLTREGGHSHRRVVHAADATGRAVETSLAGRVRQRGNVHLFEHRMAVELITSRKLGLAGQRCLGAYVLDVGTGRVETFRARTVVLATGGASKAYLYTTNPDGATGDGLAMAWRAGCRVANLEFMQFHPTCLYHVRAKSFLLSEALRGEGARLLLPDGTRFMPAFDRRAELAPRDIVARAIDHEMKRLGLTHVLLDISHQPADFIRKHFPNLDAQTRALGHDMTREALPVVPAAHYTCGGVLTDARGRSDLPGLYAVGEVACTGLHGANRMASNSLLECIVLGTRAADDIAIGISGTKLPPELPAWDESRVTDSDEEVVVAHNWDELRRFMWDYVGIVRTTKRLQRARHRAELLLREINEYYGNFRVTGDLIELRNLTLAASLIIRSALRRRESRGLHYTLDHPAPDTAHPPRNTVLVPERYAGDTLPVAWPEQELSTGCTENGIRPGGN